MPPAPHTSPVYSLHVLFILLKIYARIHYKSWVFLEQQDKNQILYWANDFLGGKTYFAVELGLAPVTVEFAVCACARLVGAIPAAIVNIYPSCLACVPAIFA